MNSKLKRALISLSLTVSMLAIGVMPVKAETVNEEEKVVIISEDTTYLGSEFVNKFDSDVIVEEGVTLTIDPNCKLQFSKGHGLIVKGDLICLGGRDKSVKFSSKDGEWDGIEFDWVSTEQHNSQIVGADIKGADTGIKVRCSDEDAEVDDAEANLRVSQSDISDCFTGVEVLGGDDVVVDTTKIYKCDAGIRFTGNNNVSDTNILEHNNYGVIIDGDTCGLYNNSIQNNKVGVRIIGEKTIDTDMVYNAIVGNNYSFEIGDSVVNKINVDFNYWGDMEGEVSSDAIKGTMKDNKGLVEDLKESYILDSSIYRPKEIKVSKTTGNDIIVVPQRSIAREVNAMVACYGVNGELKSVTKYEGILPRNDAGYTFADDEDINVRRTFLGELSNDFIYHLDDDTDTYKVLVWNEDMQPIYNAKYCEDLY